MKEEQFIALLDKFHTRQLSGDELTAFLDAAGDPRFESLITDQLFQELQQVRQLSGLDPERGRKVWNAVRASIHAEAPAEAGPAPVPRVHFLSSPWFRYAAAVFVIAVGVAAVVLLVNNRNHPEQRPAAGRNQLSHDIAPGGNRAVLTLSDGTTIILDTAANGAVARQGNADIVKLDDGRLVYTPKGAMKREVVMNTMSTPKGGQYQLVLPDGTKVWLNAASSITYPAVFEGKERKVRITGEAYFEVAGNPAMPFRVNASDRAEIEVLGTHFNVNAYENERSLDATLLEGAIRVNKANEKVVLKPGQQARVTGNIAVAEPVDLAGVTAWKNGIFDFNNASLEDVMRQLERWYDIQVVYDGPVPETEIRGKMYRDVHLSDILDVFKKAGLKFSMEGKKLIITN